MAFGLSAPHLNISRTYSSEQNKPTKHAMQPRMWSNICSFDTEMFTSLLYTHWSPASLTVSMLNCVWPPAGAAAAVWSAAGDQSSSGGTAGWHAGSLLLTKGTWEGQSSAATENHRRWSGGCHQNFCYLLHYCINTVYVWLAMKKAFFFLSRSPDIKNLGYCFHMKGTNSICQKFAIVLVLL